MMTPAERLGRAKSGERFTFAPEEPLGDVVLPRGVTDLTIEGGVFRTLRVSRSRGIRLLGCGVHYRVPEGDEVTHWAVVATNCDDLAWIGGRLEAVPRPDGVRWGTPFRTSGECTGVHLEGLWVSGWDSGLRVLSGSGHTIRGNEVARCRATHISLHTSGRSVIEGNLVHSPFPQNYGGTGDHGNLIATRPIGIAPGIVIRDNVCVVGVGGERSFMGIDVKRETSGGPRAYEGMQIVRNLVSTRHGFGIRVQDMNGGLIEGNTLHWPRGSDRNGPTIHVWQNVRRDSEGRPLIVRGNAAAVTPYKLAAEDLASLRIE